MKVTVKVTQEMTDRRNGPALGDPDYSQKCMVAQALRPLLRDGIRFSVGHLDVIAMVGKRRSVTHFHRWSIDPHLRHLIELYDLGLVVEPFEFELDIPADLLRDPERK